jgi:hypothetical protein
MYRLYVDEVGTDGLTNLEKDKHRYLSLTGVAMKIDYARDHLTPNLNWVKSTVFNHDPDDPLVFHRKDIMGYKGPYECLRVEEKAALFNKAMLRLYDVSEYVVITALIDKLWMLKQEHWERKHPYHYLMEVMVEKYTQFLERKSSIGDIMPESRQGKDELLQSAFASVRENGTDFVEPTRISSTIRAKSLKFRTKRDNIAGLQLCDLIAHPSHMFVRHKMQHDVCLGPFSRQVSDILWLRKYDRSPYNGKIMGYGIKHMPQ